MIPCISLNDLAVVTVSDEWGYINTTVKIVIEPQFEWVDYFMGDYPLKLLMTGL